MTDEQRKAAIEKAAVALYARGFVPPLSWEAAERDWLSECDERIRWAWRNDAEAALESVGYFELVGAAKALQERIATLKAFDERYPPKNCTARFDTPYIGAQLDALFAVLKEVPQ